MKAGCPLSVYVLGYEDLAALSSGSFLDLVEHRTFLRVEYQWNFLALLLQ